jgi:hypothetical protein
MSEPEEEDGSFRQRETEATPEEPQPTEAAETQDSATDDQASSPVGITNKGWFNRRPPNRKGK